jgi:lysophospholipase L1-like esterase
MQFSLAHMLMLILSLVGPAPKDTPQQLQLKQGDLIVAMGDSITQGGGGATGYLSIINRVLADNYPDLKIPKVVNAGISGQKAEDMVKRFDKDVVQRHPQWVTISVGVNDVWHRLNKPHDDAVLAKYKENVAAMVDMAQKGGAKVIIISPTLIQEDPEAEGNKRLQMYIKAEEEIAAEKKCQFVNLHAMFTKVLAEHSDQLKPDKNNHILTKDGVHMNPAGDSIMAIGILRAMGVSDDKITVKETKPLP